MKMIVLFFLMAGGNAGASVLGDLAAQMKGGTWVEVPQTNIGTVMGGGAHAGNLAPYAMSAAWDPAAQRMHFLGGDHGCNNSWSTHVYYDIPSNAWTSLGAVSLTGGCHGWDHITIDPKNRKLYFSPYGTLNVLRYDLLTNGPWSSQGTAPATGIVGITHGLSWFEGAMAGAGASGALVIYNGQATGGECLVYDPEKDQWIADIKGFGGVSTYHGFCEYSKVHNAAVMGGGNLNPRKVWRLNADKTVTALPDAPVDLGTQRANVVPDPVTGNFLAMGYGVLWELDPTGTGHWTLQTGGRVPPAAVGNPGSPDLASVISTALSNHNANLYVTCRGTNCNAYLYKHAGPFDTLPITQIQLEALSDTIEQFLTTTLRVITTYQGGVRDTSNPSCTSLDPGILSLSVGMEVVTGTGLGTGRIAVYKRGATDTMTITVVPSTATLDSIQVFPASLGLLTGEAYPLSATGFFHKNAQNFSRNLDAEAQWTSLQTSVASVASGKVTGVAAGGPVSIVAAQAGVSDTTRVTVWPKPAFIKRINFQVSSSPWSYGWLADNGGAYSGAAGYGWVGASGLTTRDDRMGTNNFLLKSFVSTGSSTAYRVAVPDGDYIIKLGVGDPQYGSTDTVWHGSNIVLTHTGKSNAIGVDTVTVAGGGGLVLNVKGVFNYLVVISKEGIDVNQVADDGGTALPLPPAAVQKVTTPAASLSLTLSPNPVRVRALIRVLAPEISSVKVFDLRGRTVADLLGASLRRGSADFSWKISGFSSGVYIVRVSAGKRILSKRFVLQK